MAQTHILIIANGPIFHYYKLIQFCSLNWNCRNQRERQDSGSLFLICTPSNKWFTKMDDKFLWGKDSLILGLAKNGMEGFMIYMITRCGHSAITARADLCDALLTTHKLESPWPIFSVAGSVDGE